jgi:hypothetical protein
LIVLRQIDLQCSPQLSARSVWAQLQHRNNSVWSCGKKRAMMLRQNLAAIVSIGSEEFPLHFQTQRSALD